MAQSPGAALLMKRRAAEQQALRIQEDNGNHNKNKDDRDATKSLFVESGNGPSTTTTTNTNTNTMHRATSTGSKLMYLPKDIWSKRYDANFYCLDVVGYRYVPSQDALLTELLPLEENNSQRILQEGKSTFPAYYYEIQVLRGHGTSSIFRRYSQFKWLFEQWMHSPPTEEQPPPNMVDGPIRLPPPGIGVCDVRSIASLQFFRCCTPAGRSPPPNDAFARKRVEQLKRFLHGAFDRPGYASHPASLVFLGFSTEE